MFNGKFRADLVFLDDAAALHVADVFPRCPLLLPVQSKNPQGVWDVRRNAWLGIFGQPTGNRADEGSANGEMRCGRIYVRR